MAFEKTNNIDYGLYLSMPIKLYCSSGNKNNATYIYGISLHYSCVSVMREPGLVHKCIYNHVVKLTSFRVV